MRGKRREEAIDTRGKNEDRERKKPEENESSKEEEVSKVRKKEKKQKRERCPTKQVKKKKMTHQWTLRTCQKWRNMRD